MTNMLIVQAVPIGVFLENRLLDLELVRSAVWAEEIQQDVDPIVHVEDHETFTRKKHARLPALESLKEGETAMISISFAPKMDEIGATELGIIASFGVAQWATTSLRLTLKGGTPLGTRENVTHVTLKGFLSGRGVEPHAATS